MSPNFQKIHRDDYGKLIAAILSLCLVAAAGYALRHTISCLMLSWIIAYLLDPLLVRAEKYGVKRVRSLLVLYGVAGVAGLFFLAIVFPKLTMGWDSFIRDIPSYIQQTKQIAMDWKSRLPDHYGSDEIEWLIAKTSDNIDAAVQKTLSMAYSLVGRVFFNIFDIVLSPILVFFMLYYKQAIIDTSKTLVPPKYKSVVLNIAQEVNSSIGGYLRGQVVISIIVAILTSLSLFVLGIPHPLLCGVFSGAASVLPFVGVIIAVIPPLAFSWLEYQSVAVLFQTAAVFGVIYFFEGYIIKPLIFKESMNLNPFMIIVMIMALGELMGFWGILLALPIAAAIKITWDHAIRGDFGN